MNPVLTVAEVATLLACEPETIEEATRLKRLPGIKYGRSWVYPADALLQALNDQAQQNLVRAANVVPLPTTKPRRNTPPQLP